MKYLSMLERLDEGELVRAEDGGWLEEREVVEGYQYWSSVSGRLSPIEGGATIGKVAPYFFVGRSRSRGGRQILRGCRGSTRTVV